MKTLGNIFRGLVAFFGFAYAAGGILDTSHPEPTVFMQIVWTLKIVGGIVIFLLADISCTLANARHDNPVIRLDQPEVVQPPPLRQARLIR